MQACLRRGRQELLEPLQRRLRRDGRLSLQRLALLDGRRRGASGNRAPVPAKAKKATKAKAATTRLLKRIPGTGLQEGERRYWCLACQKSFTTTEDEPQACPKGHRADDEELKAAAE